MEKAGSLDAIIIGAGIAGLGAGGLLQNEGFNTLIFEKSRLPGGRSKTYTLDGGWKIDSGAHCIDLGERSPCAKLLYLLGQEIPWSRNLEGFIFYDEGRWKSMAEYLALEATNRESIEKLMDWIASVSDDEIEDYDSVSLKTWIDQKVASPRIAELMKIVGMIQTTLTDPDAISAGEFLYLYREALQNGAEPNFPFSKVRMPLGGVSTMIQAMVESYQKRGGRIQLKTAVKGIRFLPAGGLEVLTETENYETSRVIFAVPVWDLLKILPIDEMANLAPDWTRRMQHFERETSASMGFTIGVSAPLFTEPCYRSAWCLPNIGLPLQILGHTAFDDTIAPLDHMIAFIGACCKPEQALDKSFREKTLSAFWDLVCEMFPRVEETLLWKQEAFFVGVDGLSRSPGLTGRFRPSVRLPERPGLYFAGDCYTGRGIGMNAAANSAMICVREILSPGKP